MTSVAPFEHLVKRVSIVIYVFIIVHAATINTLFLFISSWPWEEGSTTDHKLLQKSTIISFDGCFFKAP